MASPHHESHPWVHLTTPLAEIKDLASVVSLIHGLLDISMDETS
jgi:hypothetical protein